MKGLKLFNGLRDMVVSGNTQMFLFNFLLLKQVFLIMTAGNELWQPDKITGGEVGCDKTT